MLEVAGGIVLGAVALVVLAVVLIVLKAIIDEVGEAADGHGWLVVFTFVGLAGLLAWPLFSGLPDQPSAGPSNLAALERVERESEAGSDDVFDTEAEIICGVAADRYVSLTRAEVECVTRWAPRLIPDALPSRSGWAGSVGYVDIYRTQGRWVTVNWE